MLEVKRGSSINGSACFKIVSSPAVLVLPRVPRGQV